VINDQACKYDMRTEMHLCIVNDEDGTMYKTRNWTIWKYPKYYQIIYTYWV